MTPPPFTHTHTPKHTFLSSAAFLQTTPPPHRVCIRTHTLKQRKGTSSVTLCKTYDMRSDDPKPRIRSTWTPFIKNHQLIVAELLFVQKEHDSFWSCPTVKSPSSTADDEIKWVMCIYIKFIRLQRKRRTTTSCSPRWWSLSSSTGLETWDRLSSTVWFTNKMQVKNLIKSTALIKVLPQNKCSNWVVFNNSTVYTPTSSVISTTEAFQLHSLLKWTLVLRNETFKSVLTRHQLSEAKWAQVTSQDSWHF